MQDFLLNRWKHGIGQYQRQLALPENLKLNTCREGVLCTYSLLPLKADPIPSPCCQKSHGARCRDIQQFVSSPDTRALAEAHRHLQTACSHSRYQIPERRAGTQSHQLLKSTLQHRHRCCSFPPSMDNPIFNRASCVGTHLSVAESNQGGLTLTEFWIHLCDSPARSQPEQ